MDGNACTGLGFEGDHCCYVSGKRCPFLREHVAGRRFACGLLVEYGSWDVVVSSVEYEQVGSVWSSLGLPFNYCETFDPAFCCRPELRNGRDNDNAGRDTKPGTVIQIKMVDRGDLG